MSKQPSSRFCFHFSSPWRKDIHLLSFTRTTIMFALTKPIPTAICVFPRMAKQGSVLEEWRAKQRWSNKFVLSSRTCCFFLLEMCLLGQYGTEFSVEMPHGSSWTNLDTMLWWVGNPGGDVPLIILSFQGHHSFPLWRSKRPSGTPYPIFWRLPHPPSGSGNNNLVGGNLIGKYNEFYLSVIYNTPSLFRYPAISSVFFFCFFCLFGLRARSP